MYFLIVKKPNSLPAYCGVHRLGPQYKENLPDDSPFNTAWKQYVSGHGETIREKDLALHLVEVFDPKNIEYELIGVKSAESDLEGALGYDVACNGWHSMLAWKPPIHWSQEQKDLQTLGPLLNLVETYFVPNLNMYGLFSTFPTAKLFTEVTSAIEKLVPGSWEAPGHYHPEILAIFKMEKDKK